MTTGKKHGLREGMIVAITLLFVWGLNSARAQGGPPNPIHWAASVKGTQHAFRPGQRFDVSLSATIDSGWHVYALSQPPGSPVIATVISVPEKQPFELAGEIDAAEPISKMDPTVGAETKYYENSATFLIPLEVEKKAEAGKRNVEVNVRFQMCNDRLCLPPRTEKVEAPVEVTGRGRAK